MMEEINRALLLGMRTELERIEEYGGKLKEEPKIPEEASESKIEEKTELGTPTELKCTEGHRGGLKHEPESSEDVKVSKTGDFALGPVLKGKRQLAKSGSTGGS